jgi:hypothetical protein
MSSGFDLDKKRPLEIRVIDRRDEGGRSQREASEQSAAMADAFLLVRVLVEQDKVALAYSALEGWTAEEMSFEALFNLWLALAGRLARFKTEREDHEKLRLFAERVLNLMRLNTALNRLEADVAAEPAVEATPHLRLVPDASNEPSG